MSIYLISNYIIIALYFLLIGAFIIGWKRNKTFTKEQVAPFSFFISVVIALKDEERNIHKLIKSLIEQSYSNDHFEIIMINDNSTDRTSEIINSYLITFPNISYFNLENKSGKKAAIELGVRKSKGTLIVTTDADCMHEKDWLKTIASFYNFYKPKLIINPVIMNSSNAFEAMQALDFQSLVVSGAGAAGINQPIMCNAANMAFEKDAFLKIENPLKNEYQSGDDVFLLLNIKKRNRKDIRFIKNKTAICYTNAKPTFKSFFNQRLRWASKSSGYNDYMLITTAILVFLTNFYLLTNIFLLLIYSRMLTHIIIQLIVKAFIDFCLLYISCKYYQNLKLLRHFIQTELANIFLIPIISFGSLFYKKKW